MSASTAAGAMDAIELNLCEQLQGMTERDRRFILVELTGISLVLSANVWSHCAGNATSVGGSRGRTPTRCRRQPSSCARGTDRGATPWASWGSRLLLTRWHA
jgi:hypothetical protein